MEELHEKEDRERRSNNVMMFNVPESNKDDSKERVYEDTEICSEVLNERLKVEEVEIEQVYCLGRRQEGKMRPLTVKLTRGRGKWEAIKKAKQLKEEKSEDWIKQMRDLEVKRGGGLTILMKKREKCSITEKECKNPDIL
ncbi:hypothetical protein SK128_020618 [Halocaridina rubra]|uniref:Uncharacterized protein n=1 Tax=Halocaridina rubra TaxID=373956 RepID=A0AAN8X120_HALRR